ncbi:uncharacterized protein LOC142645814 [Dermatophagoides pteronyssinus]|uniref:uncharacterized protein LOC142645814 n=1 Tax=Dermatophagoides pteronyssinus TaxID=6956 RepID=UPI003F67ABC8
MDNHNKQLVLIIIINLNNMWMVNGDKSFLMRGIEGKTEWDMVRYPYKSVYGLPKSLQCSDTIQHQFNECEKSSHRKWKVTIDEYFYETKQFCCFVWHAMACEIEIAAKCNRNYSQQIETNTRHLFTSVCDKIRSSQRSWNCFWTEDMIIIVGVVATVITVALIAVSAYLGCRQFRANAKLKEQAEIGKKFKISTKKLTTSDIGEPTNARKIQSSQILTTTVDHSDKPEQNVEKQGKFRKWIGKIFPSSSSSKPNKNEKLTTKDIGQPKDTIPSTTTTNVDHLDKPIELSEWSPQTPKKINTQHVGLEPKDFNIPNENIPNENILPPIEQKFQKMWEKALEKHKILLKEALIRQQQNKQQVNGIRRLPIPILRDERPQNPLPAPRPIGDEGRFPLINEHQQPPPVVAQVAPPPQQPPMQQPSASITPPPSPGSDASSLSAYTPSPPNSPQPISEQPTSASSSALRSSPVRQRSPPSSPPPTSRRRLMTDNLQPQPIPGPSGQQLPSNLIQNPTNTERSDLQEIANLVNDLIGNISNEPNTQFF